MELTTRERSAVGIVTSTFYQQFEVPGGSIDTVRGNLALQMVQAAKDLGYAVVVVEGGSSGPFVHQMLKTGASVIPQSSVGMSAARQQGFAHLFEDPDIDVCVWIEPEKVSFIRNGCADISVKQLHEYNVSLVIPSRTDASFSTYPVQQADSESFANAMYNEWLQAYSLLPQHLRIDAFFGPRVFRRSALRHFLARYKFMHDADIPLQRMMNLGSYSNALFFPIVSLLHAREHIASVDVAYEHDAVQTKLESENAGFANKRIMQRRGIIAEHVEFLRYLHGQPSLIKPVDL